MVLNGAIGASLHIPFAVIVRSGFGYYFAYFAIVSRSILAMFWLGIQGANGAKCLTVMLSSIWPSYNEIPDRIGYERQGISSQGMISYFLFWIIQLPLLLIPPTRLRWLFVVKLIAAPVTAIATMAWCIHKAGGGGPLFEQKPTVSGSTYAYLWLSCMSSVTGSWSTLACNIPDFSRYAKSTKGQYVQLPALPIIFTLCGVIGVVTTSATNVIWPEDGYLWNPLDIMTHWQENGRGGRAAAFFAATSWYIATVGTNITVRSFHHQIVKMKWQYMPFPGIKENKIRKITANLLLFLSQKLQANSISAANDLTVLFPKWINIYRGCILAAIIGGWVIVPWKILSSATTFLAFMGGYSVFLAPIAGIICSDFWLVKNQHLDVPALYNPRGRYRYWHGINWQGFFAFLVAVLPNLPGLAESISANLKISEGARNLYTICWLYGFVSSIVVYVGLHAVFPAKASLVERTIDGVEVVSERKEYSTSREGSEDDEEKSQGGEKHVEKVRVRVEQEEDDIKPVGHS